MLFICPNAVNCQLCLLVGRIRRAGSRLYAQNLCIRRKHHAIGLPALERIFICGLLLLTLIFLICQRILPVRLCFVERIGAIGLPVIERIGAVCIVLVDLSLCTLCAQAGKITLCLLCEAGAPTRRVRTRSALGLDTRPANLKE